MRRTRVPSIAPKPGKFQGLKRVLLHSLFFFAQPSRGERERHGNQLPQQQQQQTNTKPVGTGSTAGSKQDMERSISSFSRLFFCSFSSLFFPRPGFPEEESRARCHLDPLENSVAKWARK